MILLAAESAMLYESLAKYDIKIVEQFFHHPWHGLRFWDLVQPAFMTMAGSALFFSYRKKIQSGISWAQNGKHVLNRSLKLFVCGVGLHCVYNGKIVWELWNVLTQLSVTTLIAYLMINRSIRFQIVVSALLLILTEILYRFVLMPGFDQPFVFGKNFGSWMDTVLMGKVNSDGWVAINFIPTAVHTIAGVCIGKLLVLKKNYIIEIEYLLLSSLLCLIAGYSLDFFDVTPIIKRISTSSFVLTSLGWVILIFIIIYWVVDILKMNKKTWIITVVGMNAIFIYLFFETVGRQWLNGVVKIFTDGIFFYAGNHLQEVLAAIVVLIVEWGICFWLYKRKIFFKL